MEVVLKSRFRTNKAQGLALFLSSFLFGLSALAQHYTELKSPYYDEAWKCVTDTGGSVTCYIHRVDSFGHSYHRYRPIDDPHERAVSYASEGLFRSREYCRLNGALHEVGLCYGVSDTTVYFARLDGDTAHEVLANLPREIPTHYLGDFWKMIATGDTLVASGTAHYKEPLIGGGYKDLEVVFFDPVTDSIYVRVFQDTQTVVYGRDIVWNAIRNTYAIWFQGVSDSGRFQGYYELDRQFNPMDTFYVLLDQPEDTTQMIGILHDFWAESALSGGYLHQLISISRYDLSQFPVFTSIPEYMLIVFDAQTMEVVAQRTLGKDSGNAFAGFDGLAAWENGTFVAGNVHADANNLQVSYVNSAIRISKLLSDGSIVWQQDYVPDDPKHYVVYGANYSRSDSTLVIFGTVYDETDEIQSVNPFFFLLDSDGIMPTLSDHPSFKWDIELYPNPTSDILHVRGIL